MEKSEESEGVSPVERLRSGWRDGEHVGGSDGLEGTGEGEGAEGVSWWACVPILGRWVTPYPSVEVTPDAERAASPRTTRTGDTTGASLGAPSCNRSPRAPHAGAEQAASGTKKRAHTRTRACFLLELLPAALVGVVLGAALYAH